MAESDMIPTSDVAVQALGLAMSNRAGLLALMDILEERGVVIKDDEFVELRAKKLLQVIQEVGEDGGPNFEELTKRIAAKLTSESADSKSDIE